MGLPKAEKRDGGARDSIDTALALRTKQTARRNMPHMPGVAYLSLSMPGMKQQPYSMADAFAASAASAEQAGQAAKEAHERAKLAHERAKEAHERAREAAERVKAAKARVEAAEAEVRAASQRVGAAAEAAQAAGAAPEADKEMETKEEAEEKEAEADEKEAEEKEAPPAASAPTAAEPAAAGAQRPAASAVASGAPPPVMGISPSEWESLAKIFTMTKPAAGTKPASGGTKPGEWPEPVARFDRGPRSASAQPGVPIAASKATPPAVRRGDRVSYVGRVHPSLAAAQERLDQLQAAISRVEASGSQRHRDYLPQLLVRRTLVAAQSQRVPRMQGLAAPPIGSRGRVVSVAGDKVRCGGLAGSWLGRRATRGCIALSADACLRLCTAAASGSPTGCHVCWPVAAGARRVG